MEPPGCTMAVTPVMGALDVVAEGEESVRAKAHAGHLAEVGLLSVLFDSIKLSANPA